jgi:hypothetical protein
MCIQSVASAAQAICTKKVVYRASFHWLSVLCYSGLIINILLVQRCGYLRTEFSGKLL